MILSYFFFFFFFFFFNDTATTEIYTVSYTLSLHDALPISDGSSLDLSRPRIMGILNVTPDRDRKSTSELQSQLTISYAVFCLKKKKKTKIITNINRRINIKKKNNKKMKKK